MTESKRLRDFGLVVGGILILLSWAFGRKGFAAAPILLALGGLGVLLALVKPEALGLAERGWMGLGKLLAKVTTPVFLAGLYYLFVTPYAVVMRLAQGDILDEKPDPAAKSYWKRRSGHPEPSSYERQF